MKIKLNLIGFAVQFFLWLGPLTILGVVCCDNLTMQKQMLTGQVIQVKTTNEIRALVKVINDKVYKVECDNKNLNISEGAVVTFYNKVGGVSGWYYGSGYGD